MEFQCLWLTTSTQFDSWKALLTHLPFPLTHKNYNEHLTSINKKNISICIWSEEEFFEVPISFREELSKTQKNALLIVSESRFACKAFELGFSFCIHESEIAKRLFSTVVDMLIPIFKPQNKPAFLIQKLWFISSKIEEGKFFIPLEEVFSIEQKKAKVWVHTKKQSYTSAYPIGWLKAQCIERPEYFCLNDELLINTDNISSIVNDQKEQYDLYMQDQALHSLSKKQYQKLEKFFVLRNK
jgi:acyl transferase domain-containing protein